MRAIPYNDGGQFRHSDFVSYLPDFLKNEPDVVGFVQVMSDYINNAYRNLRSTTEFEFVRVCAETDVFRVKRELSNVMSMFEHAMHRASPIMLLSAPRNNVRTNAALGNVNAEYPLEIRVSIEKTEQIENASLIGVGKNIADGQVVYVEFSDGESSPYYYDKASDTLLPDPMGSSQDPFDGTPNTPDSVVAIVVDDVEKVYSRYLKSLRNISYYEVYFRFHVSSVDRVAETGVNGSLVVDYLNYMVTSGDNRRTTLVTTDTAGYTWKNGFPTGMFYLRDMSGTDIVNVDGSSDTIQTADPVISDVAEKCAIEGADYSAGILSVTFRQLPTIADGAICYLVNRRAPDIYNEFKISFPEPSGALALDGKVKLSLIPTRSYDIESLVSNISQYDFIQYPLFESYWSLDYEHPKVTVQWDAQIPLCGNSTVTSKNVSFRQYREADLHNETVYRNYVPSADLCSREQEGGVFYLDSDNFEIGDPVYAGDLMWPGIAYIRDKQPGIVRNGIEYTKYILSDGVFVSRNSYGHSVDLIRLYGGIATAVSDDNAVCYYTGASIPGAGDYVLLTSVDDFSDRHLMQVASAKFNSITFDCSTLSVGQSYYVTRLLRDDRVFATGVQRYVFGDTNTRAVLSYATGLEITTAKWLIARDRDTGNTALLSMTTGVKTQDDTLADGDLVYDAMSDQISVIRHGQQYVDKLACRAFSFRAMYNQFVPFYGQFSTLELGEEPNFALPHNVLTSLTYIRKVNTTSMKFGFKDREWLYHATELDNSAEHRNGFIEIMSAGQTTDMADSDLSHLKSAYIDYPVVKYGFNRIETISISSIMAVGNDGKWTVTVTSAAHGLADGVLVDISGISSGDPVADAVLFNRSNMAVHVIDNDVISYEVTSDVQFDRYVYDIRPQNAVMTYDRSYRYSVLGVRVSDEPITGHTYLLRIEAKNGEGVLPVGTEITFSGCLVTFQDVSGQVALTGTFPVVSDPAPGSSDADKYVCIQYTFSDDTLAGRHGIPSSDAVIKVPPKEGDIVVLDDEYYRVTAGVWEELDAKAIIVPCTVYSRQNLFDVTSTNPSVSMGDPVTVRSIRYMGDGKALVELARPLPDVSKEDAGYIADSMEVFISNVYPTEYNGWHTVAEVMGSGFIVIRIAEQAGRVPLLNGSAVDNRVMELRPGTWYKYTVNRIEWDRISHCITYSLQNVITEIHQGVANDGENPAWTYITTRIPHRLSEHDYAVVDYAGNGVADMEPGVPPRISRVTVMKVLGDNTFAASGLSVSDCVSGTSTVFRGYVFDRESDNVRNLRGVYSFKSETYGKVVRFSDGDVVVALSQSRPDERIGWRVTNGMAWSPVRMKRVLKIRDIEVEMAVNPVYDGEDTDKYVYVPHTHVSVMREASYGETVYTVPRGFARNYNFANRALENIDTVNNGMLQYSSKYDYGTVASRVGMDESFAGVPDMGYPLAEKIERLAYLRDPSVIDYELIGYLARFMGFDISGMDDNINENPLYNTEAMRRMAVRSVVENLPDIYAHSGTAPGMTMVMSLFGVVGDIVTKWTETGNPYGELLTADEVAERIAVSGEETNHWVPTPHIDVVVKSETATGRSLVGINSIEYLKEIIKVIKPINVVFDRICIDIDANLKLDAGISVHGGTLGTGSSLFVSALGDNIEVIDGPITEDCQV